MKDIFYRMKEGKFTDKLLQDMVREFGLPSSISNLPDTLINMAACSTKTAACFWLTADSFWRTASVNNAIKDSLDATPEHQRYLFVGHDELFDIIVETLKNA